MASRFLGPEVLNILSEPRDELEALILESPGVDRMLVPKMSHLLLAQLCAGFRYRIFDPWPALDELRHLEDPGHPTRTRAETPFRGERLLGLHHKHYFEPRYLLGNMNAAYALERGGNENLEDAAHFAFDRARDPKELAGLMGELLTTVPYATRSANGTLSGEWIVYAAEAPRNAYLLLASHREGDEEIERAIFEHCEPSFVDAFRRVHGGGGPEPV